MNINPTIDAFTGNAGFTGIGIGGILDGFNTGTFTGINIDPGITGDADNATGIRINMGGITGSNIRAMDIIGDVSITGSLTFSGALSIGQLNAFYGSNPIDGGGNPQGLHGLTSGMTALDSVTTANADAIGVNTAMLVTLEDNSVTTSGPFQLGFTALALPCVVETHTGATLDYMSGVTAAINLVGSSTGGTIDELRIMRSVPIPNGITTINKSFGYFYHEPFGGVATDAWGIYILDAQKNYLESPLKIGGADSPTSGFDLDVEGNAQFGAGVHQFNDDGSAAISNGQISITTSGETEFFANVIVASLDCLGTMLVDEIQTGIDGEIFIRSAGSGGSVFGNNTFPVPVEFFGDIAHKAIGNFGLYGTAPVAQPTSSGVATAGGTYTATEQAMLQQVYDAVRAWGGMS